MALAACDLAPVSSASPSAAPATSESPTPAPTATAAPTAAPSPGPSPFPSATAPASPPPTIGPVDLRFLGGGFVPGSALRSARDQIVWSGGPVTSSRIWRYVPGAVAPELVVDLPRAGSTISDVVASSAGFAFVEVNSREFDPGGWRIWFVERPGGQLVELDRGLAYGAGFPPPLAMDGRRIAWAAFDEPPGGDVSLLRMVSIDDLDAVTTLRRIPVRDGLLWLPALHGDELWHAILHPDWDGTGGGDEFHIEVLDLSSPGSPPTPFEGTANDFSPAVSDSHVAWKTAVGDGAALNWGTITVEERATGARWVVPLGNLNRPSLGTRFMAFEEITHSRLAVFDLSTALLVDLLPADLTEQVQAGELFVGGQSISGSLLAFFIQEPDGLPRIGWALLPE